MYCEIFLVHFGVKYCLHMTFYIVTILSFKMRYYRFLVFTARCKKSMFSVSYWGKNVSAVSFTSKMSIFSKKLCSHFFQCNFYFLEHYAHKSFLKGDFQKLPMGSKNGHL